MGGSGNGLGWPQTHGENGENRKLWPTRGLRWVGENVSRVSTGTVNCLYNAMEDDEEVRGECRFNV